jgi:hypothetical protein
MSIDCAVTRPALRQEGNVCNKIDCMIPAGQHGFPDGGRRSSVTAFYKHGPPDGGPRSSVTAFYKYGPPDGTEGASLVLQSMNMPRLTDEAVQICMSSVDNHTHPRVVPRRQPSAKSEATPTCTPPIGELHKPSTRCYIPASLSDR